MMVSPVRELSKSRENSHTSPHFVLFVSYGDRSDDVRPDNMNKTIQAAEREYESPPATIGFDNY